MGFEQLIEFKNELHRFFLVWRQSVRPTFVLEICFVDVHKELCAAQHCCTHWSTSVWVSPNTKLFSLVPPCNSLTLCVCVYWIIILYCLVSLRNDLLRLFEECTLSVSIAVDSCLSLCLSFFYYNTVSPFTLLPFRVCTSYGECTFSVSAKKRVASRHADVCGQLPRHSLCISSRSSCSLAKSLSLAAFYSCSSHICSELHRQYSARFSNRRQYPARTLKL